MQKINESEIEREHRISPKQDFEIYRKHISLALGGKKDVGVWGGGHPFDVELSVLPAGKKNYPLHSHAAQTEYYIILSGTGTMHSDAGSHDVGSGDHMVLPPGEAHQLENTSEQDLVYYVISDHHRADITTYPKTGKKQLKPDYTVIKPESAIYYADEE